MQKFAVIGASSGTGLEIVRLLASRGQHVRAISRRPPQARPFVEPYCADVTDAQSITKALDGAFDVVFFTVDIHERFASRLKVRSVMFDGCVNAIEALAMHEKPAKFVLLSVIGSDKPSWVWHLLNAMKRGMQQNIIDREKALERSAVPYVIVRAARLVDTSNPSQPTAASAAMHSLDMGRAISRSALAIALVSAGENAPENSTWDVFADTIGPVPLWLSSTAA